MSGVIVVICIPTEEQEKCLLKKTKKKVTIEDNPHVIPVEKIYNNKGYVETTNSFDYVRKPEIEQEYKSMQKIVEDTLKQLEIRNTTWHKTQENNYFQVIFPLENGQLCEELLETLMEHKIGRRFNSMVSVVPSTIYYHGTEHREESMESQEENVIEDSMENKTGWNIFLSSVKARLTVAQVVENVKARTVLTFDFLFLLLISTTLCAIGMVENSNVYLLSSMLISPMMGPVMAGTFGTVIRDKRLQKIGVQNELIGLGIATLVGFCYGTVICLITDKYGSQEWPTYEMYSRGQLRSLWVGCLIALLSGAAVALGILSDNIASLVGVAISTSLMPPAVNAGLLWSLGTVYYVKLDETTRYTNLTRVDYYSTNVTVDLFALGAVSLCLTFVNIVCIYLAGILVFKIKEVAPHVCRDNARKRFWKHDIKIARDYNKTFRADEMNCLLENLPKELAEYQRLKGKINDLSHFSTDLAKDNSKISIKRSEYTWSPMDFTSRPNIAELHQMYDNLFKQQGNSARVLTFNNFTKTKSNHHRRLSQIFGQGLVNEEFPPLVETTREKEPLIGCSVTLSSPNASTSYVQEKVFNEKGSKKFVVTPCDVEALEDR